MTRLPSPIGTTDMLQASVSAGSEKELARPSPTARLSKPDDIAYADGLRKRAFELRRRPDIPSLRRRERRSPFPLNRKA